MLLHDGLEMLLLFKKPWYVSVEYLGLGADYKTIEICPPIHTECYGVPNGPKCTI